MWSVCKWLSQWWLVLVLLGVWCYSGWWVWDLRTIAQFQGSEMSPGLFQDFMDWYIKLSTLAVEHNVVVMIAGSQSRQSQIESYEKTIFDSHFIKFVFRISWDIKFWDPSLRLRHWGCEFFYRKDGTLICFSVLILWTLCERPMRGR